MKVRERRDRVRAILEGDRCVPTASVFDALSARIAEDLGFEAGMLGGSTASMAVTGAPDLMGLTLSEFAQLIHRICRAGELSLLVDADDGYGNAINVMRCVEEVEPAGAAGLSLEGTALPPGFGAARSDRLVPLEEGVGKMRAALEARDDPGFVIVGRTSAAAIEGLEGAIRRLSAYAEAGVDAIFPIGLKTGDELEQLHASIDLPIVLPASGEAFSDASYLASQGVRLTLHGHKPFAAAMQAVEATLRAQRDGSEPPLSPEPGLMARITRRADYDRWLDDFMT